MRWSQGGTVGAGGPPRAAPLWKACFSTPRSTWTAECARARARPSGALTRVGGGPSSEPSTPPGEVLPLLRRAGPDEVHLIDHARLLPDEQILARPVCGGATFAGNCGSVRYR